MKVREILFTQSKESLASLSLDIEAFDQAKITKEKMYLQLAEKVALLIGHAFDFGFQVGVAAIPEDIGPGETVLDINIEEGDPGAA